MWDGLSPSEGQLLEVGSCVLFKSGKTTSVSPNELSFGQRSEVFRHAESKSGLYFGISLFLKDIAVFPCRNSRQFLLVSEKRQVMVETWHSDFLRMAPLLLRIGNAFKNQIINIQLF